MILTDTVKATTGAQMSFKEEARIQRMVPLVTDNPTRFATKMTNLRKAMEFRLELVELKEKGNVITPIIEARINIRIGRSLTDEQEKDLFDSVKAASSKKGVGIESISMNPDGETVSVRLKSGSEGTISLQQLVSYK